MQVVYKFLSWPRSLHSLMVWKIVVVALAWQTIAKLYPHSCDVSYDFLVEFVVCFCI